jgi:signal peptidase I
MRVGKRLRRLVAACGLVAALVAGLLWFATATDQLTYVATRGASMAPLFEQGDLAVLRPSSAYGIGDVAAYRSRLLDTVVLHRIVARDGDRYIFKGDNNTWLDRDQPTKADLMGSLLIDVPRGGDVLAWIRGRALLLLLVVGAGFLGGGTATATHRYRRKGSTTLMPAITRSGLHWWGGATVGLGVITALFAALGLTAWARPTTSAVPARTPYEQSGQFSYAAAAAPGPVYDSGTLSTGDPIYLRQVSTLDVGFTYAFTSREATALSGTIALAAEVADGTGWTHRVLLRAAAPFHGAEAATAGPLDVARLQALLAEVRAATGVQGGRPTITLLPNVLIDATVAGRPVTERFQPSLQFRLDPMQMSLTTGEAGTPHHDLRPRENGTTTWSRTVPARLEVLGRGLVVADGRRLGLITLPVALVTLAMAGVLRRRLRVETSRIELRHGRRIVPLASATRDANVVIIDVTTMRDLVRLAEQEGRLILQQRTERGDLYLFQSDRTLYRYTAAPAIDVH